MSARPVDEVTPNGVTKDVDEMSLYKSPGCDTPKASRSRPASPEAGASFEVFRNNTTAVEVLVKQVPTRRKKNKATLESDYNQADDMNDKVHIHNNNEKYTQINNKKKLQDEIDNLKMDLNAANTKLSLSRSGFSHLVMELQKQLETVSRREIESQKANVRLQMENDKLHTRLEAKSKIITRLSKEIVTMQKLLKFVVKGLRYTPSVLDNSDPEYDDFENGLKNGNQVRFDTKVLDNTCGNGTLDSTLSKP